MDHIQVCFITFNRISGQTFVSPWILKGEICCYEVLLEQLLNTNNKKKILYFQILKHKDVKKN